MGWKARLQLGKPVELNAIASAAIMGTAFAIYLAVMSVAQRPSPAQWRAADPILHILPQSWTVWLVVGAGLLSGLGWWLSARPSREALITALGQAALGIAVAAAIAAMVRLSLGPTLPAFVPSEESAAPGFTLSMAAGYAEEVIFRIILVPILYLPLRRRVSRPVAIVATAIATGLAFALLHDLGSSEWSSAYFATRFLVPGFAMTVAYLVIGPSFLIAAHGAAHLFIPALFT